MKYYSKKQWTHKLTVMVLLAMALGGTAVQAMPSGGDIRSGQGSISQDGKNMTVLQNSDRMAIDWTKFDIAKDETVRYAQPDRNAISLNRVTGGQQSVIAGNLNANGNVALVNPNGVVFTKNSSVDVGGLVASTARLNDEAMKNFGNGKDSLGLSLDKDSTAAVINEGQIKAQGGLVALHAANVENKGTITNEGGTLAMAAAKNLTLSAADDDKLNFTVDGDLAKAQALNSGSLKADGGYVVMTAKSAGDVLSTVVNNSGTIEAKTLRKNEKGQILLDGGDNGQVEVSGTLDASGTEAGQDAGNIKVIGQKTVVHDNTNLLAKGDNNGGKIETSGDVLNLGDNLNIDAKGVNGKAGEWLLDPLEILIQDDQPTLGTADQTIGAVNEGSETQITYNDPPSATQNADATYSSTSWIATHLITDILNKRTDVTIQAASTSQAASITVNSAIKPKVEGDGEATLTLEAQRNITINKEIAADESGGKLNVKLNSDTDGDGVGAVIINADISTNGGTFTSGSGGNVVYDATVKDANGNTVYQKDSSDKYVTNSQTGEKVPEYKTAGYITDGVLSGSPKIDGHTVGTYFGYITPAGKKVTEYSENRNIITNGGDINLYGEVAIGLNGGTLTLDTSKTGGNGGAVNITGIVNSGNSYTDYIYGTDAWNQLVSNLVEEYIKAGTVPSYHFVGIYYTKNGDGTYSYTTTPHDFKKNETHYAFHEFKSGDVVGSSWTYPDTEETLDTQDTRWYITNTAGKGYNSFIMEATTPTTSKMSINDWLTYYRRTDPNNYATKYADGNANKLVTYDQIKDNTAKMANLRSDISALLAHNWYASENLAQSGTGANPGDSYLATITTALENSLSTPNSQKTLWVGARGSGVQNKTNDKIRVFTHTPADPTHPDGFYWVTGPEGLVTTTVTNADGTTTTIEGTKFWDTSSSDWTKNNYGSQVYGYTKWSSWSGGGQPDNSAPFLTVGYGNNNAWDDASVGGETTVGFVQETNLYNSSLNVKTAGGKVTLQGDIGKSVGLDTVKIDAGSGSVTTGNTQNTATKYNNGTVYADHGVYINGGEVTVGGEIHSGGTNVEATKNTDDSFKDYLDNVTIQSSGNLTVHGIEVNASTDPSGNTTSRTDGEGGKIKLVSTGTEGVITLGDGVDYNGKNTNGGVLKAASTAQGAVVIDAQGSNGGFVNKTSAEKAIDTGENGTWQIYSASPDKDTFGTNLNSGTDAQWTSKSASNTIATKNQYGKNPNSYSDIGSNKFIFQATPVITLYSEDYLKTYGDEVSSDTLNKLLKGKEVFTGLDGKTHNVTDYSSAFQEKDYTEYISGEDAVTITSDGAASTATRTGGKYEATEKSGADGKNAVYDLTVNLNDAKALDGYAIDKENGKLEIKKRTASITGTGAQTYGDTDKAIKNWTDTKKNIADGSTVSYTTSIKAGSEYTKNQNGRNTADADTYNDSVSFDNLKITDSKGNEISIADNYDLTTTGTITVGKAKLIVNTDGKTTTYGTVDESYTSKLDDSTKALNGDDADKLISDLGLTYKTDAYQDTDGDGKYDRTNHVKYTSDGKNYDSYTLDVANTNTLKNYEVTVNDSTVTLERAKATVDTDQVTTDYGKVNTSYTSHFNTAVNGDNGENLLKQLNLSYSTDAYKDDTHTNNVKDGGYSLKVQAKGSLTYNDYDVTVNDSNVTLNKVNLTVNPEDIHRIYGQAKEVQEDAKTAYNLSGFANGDTKDTVDATNKDGKTIDQLVKVTNDVSKALKDEGTHTQNASTDGYDMVTTASGDLTNYNIVVGVSKKVYLDKAALVVDTTGNTRTYGDVTNVSTDVANAASFHIKGSEATTVNGDTYADILKEMNLSTDSAAQIKDASGNVIKTGNANTNPGYDIKASFDTDLTNYAVEEGTVGKEKIEKATLHLFTGDYTEAYGDAKAVQNDLDKATTVSGEKNGDSLAELTEKIGITNTTDALLSADRTNDVKYKTDGSLDSYGITTNFNKSLDNYEVVLDKAGTVTLTPKEITIKNTMTQQYGSSDRTYKEATVPEGQLVNGDSISTKDLKFDIKSDGKYAKSLAANGSDAVTADAGTYTGELIHTGGGITHADGSDAYKNYKVTVEGDIVVTPAPLTITTKDVTTEYGTVKNTTSTVTGLVNGDQNYASDISYDYGDYGHGYLDNNTRTNNVGSYGITTKAANTTSDFLNNYTISYGDAKLTITPKDVYFHVDGKGSAFDDIIYTVTDPNHPGSSDAINSQLPYGETVTGGYGLGRALPDTPGSKDHYYTVDSTINGTPVYDNNGQGTQVGNYIYHPTGQAVIHFDQPQKPDQTTHYVEGAHRPQDKIESALPVFRVDSEGMVKQYGTYGIENKTQTVVLSPTGMRMPEPNQTSTQDRKYMTSLKTPDGQGTFRLEYNGVVLRVIPVDPAAEQIVEAGDKLKNVALSEQALHVAYTQMGLDLVNLKGIYIYMAPM